MKDLSMDLKSRAVMLLEEGTSPAKIAERLLVCKRSVERIRVHWQEHRELPVSRRKGKTATLLTHCEGSLGSWIAQRPEITLEELAEKLLEEEKVKASKSSIWRKLQSMGLRHKKKRLSRPSRTALTSPSDGSDGSSSKAAGTPRAWCS